MKLIPTAAIATAFLTLAMPAAAQTMSAAQYMKAAGAGDMFERTSSRVVLETTRNPGVKSFARMMIKDHDTSTAEVKMAARRSRMTPGRAMMTPAQNAMIRQLRAQRGRMRDTTYLTQQKASHDQALALHRAYAASGTAPALRATAGKIVPVVEHHIEMLGKM